MSSHMQDISAQDFEVIVVSGSKGRLVVVDFWAPWCGPCQVLKPLLEKLSYEYEGKFFLAKVNADDNQQLCLDYGVRGIPTVKAFLDGGVVDEFAGAMNEPYVRDFLDRNIPTPARERVKKARAAVERGDKDQAMRLLDEALALEPDNGPAALEKAALLLECGEVESAGDIVDALSGEILDFERTQQLIAKLTFARRASALASIDELKTNCQRENAPPQALLDLATRYVAQGEYEPALDTLLSAMSKYPGYDNNAARKDMLTVFEIIGSEDELTLAYRRRMASYLH